MTRYLLAIGLMLMTSLAYSQTSLATIESLPKVDSADYFLQKGLVEKTKWKKA